MAINNDWWLWGRHLTKLAHCFHLFWPCIVCCFPPCWIVAGPESKKKNNFNSLHRYFIFKQYRLWCQNKENTCTLSRPFFVNLQIPILSFIDCISIQTIFCPLQIQLGKEIRLETYALQLTFLTFPAGFWIPILFSNLNLNCSNLWDMRNLQEQVKKAFCYQKLFWPFTAWINCSRVRQG